MLLLPRDGGRAQHIIRSAHERYLCAMPRRRGPAGPAAEELRTTLDHHCAASAASYLASHPGRHPVALHGTLAPDRFIPDADSASARAPYDHTLTCGRAALIHAVRARECAR